MRRLDVSVNKRERTGKGGARSARRAGFAPGIVYGGKEEPVPVSVDLLEMEKLIHSGSGESENMLLNLKFDDGSETLTLLRDFQFHPITSSLSHIDFQRVSLDEEITTTVPVHFTGNPIGVRESGGMFEIVQRDVLIQCLPLDVPDSLDVDINNLEIGQSVHVFDLPENPKVKILTESERPLASVTTPTLMVESTEAAESEAVGEPKDEDAG